MPRQPFVYVVETYKQHGKDYNGNGVLSPGDDIVRKMGYNPATKKYDIPIGNPTFITPPVRNKIVNILKNDDGEDPVRINYNRIPRQVTENQAPPVAAFEERTGFFQAAKMGAGDMAGRVAVLGVVDVLGSLFSSEGGAKKPRPPHKPKHKKKV